jgi:hypothetical protein
MSIFKVILAMETTSHHTSAKRFIRMKLVHCKTPEAGNDGFECGDTLTQASLRCERTDFEAQSCNA